MTLIFILSLTFVSCSPYKKLAYDFVERSDGAAVALYIPNELKKINLRKDCQIENLKDIDVEDIQDTIKTRTKVVDKIDDELFFNIFISSFESALNDYNLSLTYWESDDKLSDSLHWIVDLSNMEITEFNEYLYSDCGADVYEFFPTTSINVASWIELMNDKESELLFTEQYFNEYIVDCGYYLDSTNNWSPYAEIKYVTIDDFYDFAVVLGKLYAGYSYDYFMNKYVEKEMNANSEKYSDEIYLRYDPYESYIYYTRNDRLFKIDN